MKITPWLRYLIAFVVGCHGFIYIRFFVIPVTPKVWRGSSWLLGSAITGASLEALVLALHILAGIAILACAVAIALAPSASGWWRPLAIFGAAVGIAGFAVLWDGQTQRLAQEGAIGAVISLVLLVSAIAYAGTFG